MPRFIIHHDGLFFEWSEVVDAPVSRAMGREEFVDWYTERNGADAAGDALDARLARAVEYGTSAERPESAEEMTRFNRAGPGERCLTFDEIIALVTSAES